MVLAPANKNEVQEDSVKLLVDKYLWIFESISDLYQAQVVPIHK
jgi:hypothetical protein